MTVQSILETTEQITQSAVYEPQPNRPQQIMQITVLEPCVHSTGSN